MLAEALAAHEAGICVLPPKQDGSKRPLVAWQEYQTRRSTVDEIHRWYANGRLTGLGVVLGEASGGLELLEFDDVAVYGRFKELAVRGGLDGVVHRIEGGYLEHSPNGIHWLYRCEEMSGNTKLACRPAPDGRKVLIETRGEGGFAIVAPTHGKVHPSGRSYDRQRGDWATIATISPEERAAIFDLARTLDSMPRREQRAATTLAQGPAGDDERPGDWFNRTTTWAEVLERHGWAWSFDHRDEGYWRRPGKEHGTSATTNYAGSDLLKVFSSSTPFDTETSYTRFAAYSVLDHGGDYGAAASTLARLMPERGNPRPRLESLPPLMEPPEDDDYEEPWETPPDQPEHEPSTLNPQPEVESPKVLAVRTIADAYAHPPDEPRHIIRGMLRAGELCVLGAPRALGKSWFGMNLAVLCGAGEGRLGGALEIVRPANVLYAQGELDHWESYRRWTMLCGAQPGPGVAETFDRWRLKVVRRRGTSSGRGGDESWSESEEYMDATLDARLEATVAEHGTEVLVIDPWAVYFSGSENSNDEVEAGLDKLRDLAMRYRLAVVILHHIGKSTDVREPEDLWRGASRLADWASTRITMMPHYTDAQAREQGMTRGQARRYADVFFLRRSDPTDGFSMHLNASTGWWEGWQAPGEMGAAMAVHIAPADVAKLCHEAGGWGSLREAATSLGVGKEATDRLLAAAVRDGYVVESHGPNRTRRFTLPSPSEDF